MLHLTPVVARNILLPCVFSFCSLAFADSKSITISDPRPIAKAVEQLEAIYGAPITYEDPMYIHESQVTDVTDRARRGPESPNLANRVLIPKEEPVSITYRTPSSGAFPGGGLRQSREDRNVAIVDALLTAFQSYAASRAARMFTVVEDKGLFHVVPTHFINAEGKTQQLAPLLDTTVTILPKPRTGADLVGEICQSLSQTTGRTVVVGTTPSSLFTRHATTITDTNATARSLLSRLLVEMDVPLSWQLFYDPGLHWYVLNIHTVTPANR